MAENLTGSGISQLKEMIKRVGHNNDFTVEVAQVVSPLPNISIKVIGNDLVIPKDFILATQSAVDANLVANDQILVSVIGDGQTFIILDKVVSF
jgi:hypothetical protein